MRFEVVSIDEYAKAVKQFEWCLQYEDIELPKRKTSGSAGYDIQSAVETNIYTGEVVLLPTGLKAQIDDGYTMLLFIRSSIGVKGLVLANDVAVIDSDYYNNEDNEGHFFLAVKNVSNETNHINAGDRIAQAVFVKYGTVDDDNAEETRKGGIGSTGI